jgi:hypothetical protein
MASAPGRNPAQVGSGTSRGRHDRGSLVNVDEFVAGILIVLIVVACVVALVALTVVL